MRARGSPRARPAPFLVVLAAVLCGAGTAALILSERAPQRASSRDIGARPSEIQPEAFVGEGRVHAVMIDPPCRCAHGATPRRPACGEPQGGRFFRTPSGPLYRIDPATNRVTRRIPLGDDVAFGVLAGARRRRRLRRARGRRGRVGLGAAAGRAPGALLGRDHQCLRIDDDAGELTGAVLDGDGLLATAAGEVIVVPPLLLRLFLARARARRG